MNRKRDFFQSAQQLATLTDAYFKWIEGEFHLETLPYKPTAKAAAEEREQKVWDRPPQPPTLSGLALYLGFESTHAFEAYEQHGKYATQLKRAKLHIEAEYEKQLHQQPSSGAIFALKSMGWLEHANTPSTAENNSISIKIEVVGTGFKPALTEQEALL